MIGTPSERALSNFEPALSPATSAVVFFETDPATFAPREIAAAVASSRVKSGTDPVMTIVAPDNV